MMNLTVRVDGIDTVALKVGYLTKGAYQGLKFGTSEGAFAIAEEARALVHVLTGNLQAHIHQEAIEDTGTRYVEEVAPIYESVGNEYGFTPPYARRLELGFIGRDKLGRYYHQPPYPYMRPAYDAKRGEAEAAIKQGIFAGLDEAMNQTAGRRAA